MATQFTSVEWDLINTRLRADPEQYGIPQREYGSVLLGSFNIRKLGSSRSRSPDTWEFLADVCRSFDLLAVQEIMDDSGVMEYVHLIMQPTRASSAVRSAYGTENLGGLSGGE